MLGSGSRLLDFFFLRLPIMHFVFWGVVFLFGLRFIFITLVECFFFIYLFLSSVTLLLKKVSFLFFFFFFFFWGATK
jgi:hypothetical protein